jgi:CheY-like chemotaxis protein
METAQIAPRSILVVDDEPYVCDALRMLLSLDGHRVATAGNGQEALDLFSRDAFDLVITDYSMPGIKGDELAVTLKSLKPGQPIVMITAFVESLTAGGSSPKGVDALIAKPFRIDQLRRVMSEVLR